MKSNSLTLVEIVRSLGDLGQPTVMALLNILVVDAVLFFNVGKSMDEDQVKQTVLMIVEEYHYFKPEDFKLCFKKAMKGHYGKLYDRIDGPVIFEWLNQYDFERTQEVEALQSSHNRELKKIEAQPIAPAADEHSDVAAKHIQIWKDRLQKNKVAKQPEQAKDVRLTHPIYQMHQRWMRQFDAIYQRQKRKDGSIRYIKRYGRMLDISGYLEHKQWQHTQAQNKN